MQDESCFHSNWAINAPRVLSRIAEHAATVRMIIMFFSAWTIKKFQDMSSNNTQFLLTAQALIAQLLESHKTDEERDPRPYEC